MEKICAASTISIETENIFTSSLEFSHLQTVVTSDCRQTEDASFRQLDKIQMKLKF